ncbi:MAG: GNAT family N-acetyltransferase, partial [Pseudonocardia sp.]|nr:GNAT family N-acetyltransferase [Pseudonocardia sp.]
MCAGTCLVEEDEPGIRGFLVGFHSADHQDEAYIHFVGVDPGVRGQGVARRMYTAFFDAARGAGRSTVRLRQPWPAQGVLRAQDLARAKSRYQSRDSGLTSVLGSRE